MFSGSGVKRLFGSAQPIRFVELGILIAISIVLWWKPLAVTLQLALGSDAYTHLLVIIPVSVALIYLDRKKITAQTTLQWPGAVLMALSVFLWVLVAGNVLGLRPDDNLALSIFALVVFWIGSAIVCFSDGFVRSFPFPLCFLFLLVPLPEAVVNWIIETLQQLSAIAAVWLFRAAWVPTTREGVVLSIPGLDLEVAHECSSIRSSTVLVVITLVLAHLFLRSKWRKILFVIASFPLSVAKNAVRIFTIGELGTRVDPSYLDGKLHHNGGIVFLMLAFVVDIALLWILRRGDCPVAKSPNIKTELASPVAQ
jgi:exosortase